MPRKKCVTIIVIFNIYKMVLNLHVCILLNDAFVNLASNF